MLISRAPARDHRAPPRPRPWPQHLIRPLQRALVPLLLSALGTGCLARARLVTCHDNADCDLDSYCLFLTPTAGVCQSLGPRTDAGLPSDAGVGGPVVVSETESAAVRVNDTEGTAQGIDLRPPFAIEGTIGAFDGVRPDVDYYVLSLHERTLLDISARPTTGSEAQLKVSLVSASAGGGLPVRTATGGVGGTARRQFFAPTTGSYLLRIEDARNLVGPPFVGGLGFGYQVTVTSGVPTALAVSTERSQQNASPGRNGNLPTYRLELSRGVSFVAETVAQRLSQPSPVNTALYLVRRSSPAALLAISDDLGGDAPSSDSRIAEILRSGSYDLVVDVQHIDNEEPASFVVQLGLFAQSREQEPNDSATFAFPIPAPFADVRGTIAAPTAGQRDVDVYSLRLGSGQLLRVRALAEEQLLPRIRVRGPDGALLERQENLAGANDTSIELLSIAEGVHTVEVEDARNLPASGGAPVGGDAFGYRLLVSPFDRRPQVLGPTPTDELVLPAETLARVGGKQWYRFELPSAGELFHAEVRPVGSWNPVLALYGEDGLRFVGRGGRSVARYLDAGQYWLSVSDADGRGGVQYALRLFKELAVPETALTAPPMGTAPPPLIIKGDVKDTETDLFYVDLQAGTSVDVETLPGSTYGASADTLLALTDDTGRVLASDDDGGENGLSRISDFAVPLSGRYVVRVAAKAGHPGAYLLTVRAKPCPGVPGAVEPQARPGGLAFNEVLLSALEDANGDGRASPTEDAFVELINTSASETLDLGGISLRDTTSQCDPSGEHRLFTFTCGTTLAPGHLAVIFGGGDPYGTFGGAAVTRSTYADRCRLHVDPVGDTFSLLGRDGVTPVSSFTFPDAGLCGGTPCDCRGVSCARRPDGTGAFRPSTPARQTPGRRFDGTAPGDPFAPNDLCENAREVRSGELLAGSGTTATNNNHGHCGVDTSDLVYSFTLTETRDVEISAPGAETLYVRPSCSRDPIVRDLACAPLDSVRLTDLPGSVALPQRYFVFVEASGPFVLRLQTSPPATAVPGDRCSIATPLAVGATLGGQTTVGASDDYRPSRTCGPLRDELRGPDVVYRVSLRQGQRVRARVTPSWPFDPALFVATDCSSVATQCLAATDLGVSGEPEVLNFTAPETRDYFFIVDSYASFEQGSFEITVEEQ